MYDLQQQLNLEKIEDKLYLGDSQAFFPVLSDL